MSIPRVGVRYQWNNLTFSATVPNYYGELTVAGDNTATPTGAENTLGTRLGMNVQAPGANATPVASSFSTVSAAVASGTIVRAVVRYRSGEKIATARILCPSDKVSELPQLIGEQIEFRQYKRQPSGAVALVRTAGEILGAKVAARTKVVY